MCGTETFSVSLLVAPDTVGLRDEIYIICIVTIIIIIHSIYGDCAIIETDEAL